MRYALAILVSLALVAGFSAAVANGQANCTNPGPGLCINFAYEPLHRSSTLVQGQVEMRPKNGLASYQAVLHLWRWHPGGNPVEVGLPTIVTSSPASRQVAGVSGVCRLRTRGRWLFQISGTFVMWGPRGGVKVAHRESATVGLNC